MVRTTVEGCKVIYAFRLACRCVTGRRVMDAIIFGLVNVCK